MINALRAVVPPVARRPPPPHRDSSHMLIIYEYVPLLREWFSNYSFLEQGV